MSFWCKPVFSLFCFAVLWRKKTKQNNTSIFYYYRFLLQVCCMAYFLMWLISIPYNNALRKYYSKYYCFPRTPQAAFSGPPTPLPCSSLPRATVFSLFRGMKESWVSPFLASEWRAETVRRTARRTRLTLILLVGDWLQEQAELRTPGLSDCLKSRLWASFIRGSWSGSHKIEKSKTAREFCFFRIVTVDISKIWELSQFIQRKEEGREWPKFHIWLASWRW